MGCFFEVNMEYPTDWTPEERLKIIAAWADYTSNLISEANFYTPHAAINDMQTIYFISTMSPAFLNSNRPNIEPFVNLVKE